MTKLTLGLFLCAAVLGGGALPAAELFDSQFTGSTLRLDFFHTGTAEMEEISLDRVRVEGPWPGSRTQLLDRTNLGKYQFEIVDLASQQILYSRGFASIYGEWETTSEALNGVVRTLPEALRFPEPRRPFQVRLRKRSADQAFVEIWTTTVDPGSRFVHRAAVSQQDVLSVLRNGEPAEKVDLLLLGDGYSATEMEKFQADTQRSVEALFALEPFASRKGDFNVWAIAPPAAESGISRPRSGLFRNSPLGTSYNTLDSERYVLTLRDRAWRDVAAAAPYDFVMILVNSEKYGGGGIFNLYSTAAAGSDFFPYLLVHEFGHHFAGLGDEYYTSDVAYEDFQGQMTEPWEPNITALLDPEGFKWADLVTSGAPLPTPWKKEEFEELSHSIQARRRELRTSGAPESDLERLFRDERQQMTAMLASEVFAGEVGAFEGASYQPQGLYRPEADCIMFTRDEVGFCAVCARAIDRIIDLYTR
jgi:hypothetical protein